MTAYKRIVLNVVASYGRTIISVACGLFSTRWVLQALGHESFGLFGLIGSLTIFMSFINIQLAQALNRYYAVSIGQASTADDKGTALEECRSWFTCGVMIHVVIPVVLVCLGWFVGTHAIRSGWLVIPESRVDVCVWLWRFVCFSGLIGMINTPFHAMFLAKQNIVELTAYSLVATLVKTAFIFTMTLVPIDWLLLYGLGLCIISVVPSIVIFSRAFIVYPECRFRIAAVKQFWRVKQLMMFALWNAFGGLGYLASHQCLEVVVNKFFGPKTNAAYSIGVTFAGEAASLTGSLNNAFTPAIATAYGAGDMKVFREMAMRASKFGALLTLMFAIPMFLEAKEVLRLWLRTPPAGALELCMIILLAITLEKFSTGHALAVLATGRVALFQFCHGISYLIALPTSLGLLRYFKTPNAVAFSFVLATACVVFCDVLLARLRAGLSVRQWLRQILIPLMVAAIVAGFCGYLLVVYVTPSIVRVALTTTVTLSVFFLFSYFFVLNSSEKYLLGNWICSFLKITKGLVL